MKKITLLFLTIIMMGICTTRVDAQAALLVLLFGDKVASENFYFSLKIGGNYSNLNGLDDTKGKFGLNFGLMATIKLSDKWYLVPEFAALSGKGAKDIQYIPSGIPELDNLMENPDASSMNLNYIDVPVILNYVVTEKLWIGTGPHFSFNTSAKNEYDIEVQPEDELEYYQGSQLEWNTFDFGWAFEVSYNLWEALAGKGLNVNFRYTLGLTDIIKDNPGDAVTNSVFQLSFSFPFIGDPEEEDGLQN
jgi:hypothetical protein